jgi:activator of HSP90 ATPase
MSERPNPPTSAVAPTRRQVMVGAAVALGCVATSTRSWAKSQQQALKEVPGAPEDQTRTSLHQEIDFQASAQRIYAVLLDSKLFTAFSGLPADIDPAAGGAFSMFGKLITGRNVELKANQRIVQAWRPASWEQGVYSIVKFELLQTGSGTKLVLDHTGFPEGKFGGLDSGWHERYWDPLKKFLA